MCIICKQNTFEHNTTWKLSTAPLTNTSLLVVLFPAVFALVALLIRCSGTGFAGRVTFCKGGGEKPLFFYTWRWATCHDRSCSLDWCVLCVCVEAYLCTERRCHSELRWSSRRCSRGRSPLHNRGHSCTFRSLRESRRRRTSRFRDMAGQSPRRRLHKGKSDDKNIFNHF